MLERRPLGLLVPHQELSGRYLDHHGPIGLSADFVIALVMLAKWQQPVRDGALTGVCDAEIGDELILVSHDPFTTASPYRSASPIFIHRSRCEPPGNLHDPTTQLTLRRLSVRSFDRNEMMINAAVIDGHDLGDTISEFFVEQTADRLHVHNADRGCWAVAVERA